MRFRLGRQGELAMAQDDYDDLDLDLDPAAPIGDPDRDGERLANFGDAVTNADVVRADFGMLGLAAAAPGPMPIDTAKMLAFLNACMTSQPRVQYGLGAKIPNDAAQPGRDFTKVDCSGFVRAAIRRSTAPKVAFPDGSVVQHDWVRDQGYTRQTLADGKLDDGRVRIAFLSPADSPSRIGHVVLILNGKTLESHGGVGPNSRAWTGQGWQAKARVYLLK
ncbi:hypothetical protein [Sphingomonas sp. CCH10-B3]|uniref:hypothetical protein n=1 Tax=Sphingomonas sp. CCH10-B3 TaxID=1768757 RepID=UPI001920B90A|nr:hypothetical protein [Sphingomonas sp. CCH10-B3]